jgi:hypothetical protein
MNRNEAKSLIKNRVLQILKENDNEKEKWEKDFMNRYNPELWRQWLRTGEADFEDMVKAGKDAFDQTRHLPRPGSDLDGSETIGGTNFPKGHGYPNKGSALRGDKWKERVRIDHFADVNYDIETEHQEKFDFEMIKKTGVPYYSQRSLDNVSTYWQVHYHLSDGISNEKEEVKWQQKAQVIQKVLAAHNVKDYNVERGYSEEYENIVLEYSQINGSNGLEKYLKATTGVNYKESDQESVKHSYLNSHWDTVRAKIREELENHGIHDYNVQNGKSDTYENIVEQLKQQFPNPVDVTYPSYVSVYDTTRALGGYEEGGWWYDLHTHVFSIEVHNRKQALKAAVILFKKFSQETDGIITIVAEKKKGGWSELQSTPSYS